MSEEKLRETGLLHSAGLDEEALCRGLSGAARTVCFTQT